MKLRSKQVFFREKTAPKSWLWKQPLPYLLAALTLISVLFLYKVMFRLTLKWCGSFRLWLRWVGWTRWYSSKKRRLQVISTQVCRFTRIQFWWLPISCFIKRVWYQLVKIKRSIWN